MQCTIESKALAQWGSAWLVSTGTWMWSSPLRHKTLQREKFSLISIKTLPENKNTFLSLITKKICLKLFLCTRITATVTVLYTKTVNLPNQECHLGTYVKYGHISVCYVHICVIYIYIWIYVICIHMCYICVYAKYMYVSSLQTLDPTKSHG